MHSACKSETSFVKPSKPAWEPILLMNPEDAVVDADCRVRNL